MDIKIKRFYKKIPNFNKSKINKDFDSIDDLLKILEITINGKSIKLIHTPIDMAFKTRLSAIIYQNNTRAYYLLKGIVNELNTDNLPGALPIIRAFYELMIQLGYLANQITNHNEYSYLLSNPLYKVLFGNRNEGAGELSLGKVESISIMTMIKQAEKVLNSINPEKVNNEEILTNFYATLSNQCHPNYSSNMFYTYFDNQGNLISIKDIGEDMHSIKSLTYPFYMGPLTTAVILYKLFIEKIGIDPKVEQTFLKEF